MPVALRDLCRRAVFVACIAVRAAPAQTALHPHREDTVVVTTQTDSLDVTAPDPALKVFASDDLLDANPGRPGAPLSIPGYPVETASGGIKAPQYFAPGVAGDHGEPIAQYLRVGDALVPNNLSANAHGNGYADPNLFIPQMIESVQVDGGAFNVLEGNHAVNLAATYKLRESVRPFATLTADYRDVDFVAGVSPTPQSFVAIEAAYGNGLLGRLEHRQQYKLNAQRVFHVQHHEVTALGIAYYGQSFLPGLVPLFDAVPGYANVGDTIDPRQHDQTHTALAVVNDRWTLSRAQQINAAAYFRTYNLSLFSNFGQGLIRQSEFRTVAGETAHYTNHFSDAFTLLGGVDYEREAPRRDNLDHYGDYNGTAALGPFAKVDSNDVTIASVTPYVAGAGELSRYFRYYAGWRRDEVEVQNDDLITPANSFGRRIGLNAPKATGSLVPKPLWWAPVVSLSWGEAFFTEDPRIGLGNGSAQAAGSAVATAHSYQLVLSKSVRQTEVKVSLDHVTTSEELAKIDPDTGLQQDQGPGRLRSLTVTVRQAWRDGWVLATVSKADARDLDSGGPTPEAPRTIVDVVGHFERLPFKLQARGEFEYVGRKPLGTGCAPNVDAQCVGTSVRELRLAVVRSQVTRHLDLALNASIASGYSGQTIEGIGASPLQTVVGVPLRSYVSVSATYRFGR